MSQALVSHLAVLLAGLLIGLLLGQRIVRRTFQAGLNAASMRHEGETDALIDGVKHAFTEISADAFRQTSQDSLRLAQATLQGERRLDAERSAVDRAEIDARIGQILNQMDRMQALVRELEQTRAGQLGEVTGRLDEANKRASQLTNVTDSLRRTLGHSRQRGLWGERLAEEVLQAAGMKAGISYRTQFTLANGNRPDFTFDLPGGLQLHMDVKFPFDNFQRALESDDQPTRQRFEAAFIRDVRQRIMETANRSYADAAQGSVGFALLFIPNERVFSAVFELGSGVLDEALRRQIVLVSPTSLIAVISLLRQLSAERQLSRTGRELAELVSSFLALWQSYCTATEKAGSQLDQAASAFRQLHAGRGQQLAAVAERISEMTVVVNSKNVRDP